MAGPDVRVQSLHSIDFKVAQRKHREEKDLLGTLHGDLRSREKRLSSDYPFMETLISSLIHGRQLVNVQQVPVSTVVEPVE